MDIEAYKVAVRLTLTENITKGLMAISGKFATANRDAEAFQKRLESIGKMTLAGGALVGVGLMLTKGIDATLKSAKDLMMAQADFKTLNLSAAQMAQVNGTAATLSHQVLGSTIAGNIRLIQDLHTAFGDLNHAIATAPEFTKYETTLKMALGEHAADGAVNAMAKALEHRGGDVLTNPAEFKKELAMASQVTLATKNRVRAQDFLLASQTGGMAYSFLSDRYLYGNLAALMTMFKSGDRVGTMLMTSFSSLVGGHMDQKAKGFLATLGLGDEGVSKERIQSIKNAMKGLSPEDKKIYMQSLGAEKILSGGLKASFATLFMHDPDKFVSVLEEKIRNKYGQGLSDDQVAQIISANFNRKTGDFLAAQIKNRAKLEKDSHVFRNAMDFNQAYDNYLNSPDGAGIALTSSWTNLKAVLGMQLLPTVTNMTLEFAHLMDVISDFTEKHPWAAKIAMYSVTALAGITLLSGGILLLGSVVSAAGLIGLPAMITGIMGSLGGLAEILGGPVVWAITGAVVAGAYLYRHNKDVKKTVNQMGNEFAQIMSEVWARLKLAMQHFSELVVSGFQSLFNYIISMMNALPGVNIKPLTFGDDYHLGNVLDNKADALRGLMTDAGIPNAEKTSEKHAAANSVAPNADVGKGSYHDQFKAEMERQSNKSKDKDSYGQQYAAAMGGSPYIRPNTGQPLHVTTHTHLDGWPIAKTVTKIQAKEAQRSARSTQSTFDPTMAPPTVALGR
ncbi:Phage-related minor tail protein [Serratia quinivorans]|uniref:hypothetical protein n=1 Tax=Serratia quinivorans TaxID=137545 RepID=UPI0021785E83|nr:hypothetical protein [Serratia quinivorans]CAI1511904.1 Phage-related minor tail protein [Serratia quinivorans]